MAGAGAGMKIKFKVNVPGAYMNFAQKMARGIWPWTEGPRARLPLHYKLRYIEKTIREPLPVNYEPDTRKYKVDKWGVRSTVQNTPIPLLFPNEADEGLWGGEGFLQGQRKKHDNPDKPAVWQLWKPFLTKRVLYSEILDKWMEVTVTLRTLDLVDDAKGFDHYILGTHEVDLRSKLGMKLKRLLLTTLLDKSMYPDNPEKRDMIYEKYKKHLIPKEEVEWLGLTIEEADRKQMSLEEAEHQASIRPLKEQYLEELVDSLREKGPDAPMEEKGWFSKFNPLKSKDKS